MTPRSKPEPDPRLEPWQPPGEVRSQDSRQQGRSPPVTPAVVQEAARRPGALGRAAAALSAARAAAHRPRSPGGLAAGDSTGDSTGGLRTGVPSRAIPRQGAPGTAAPGFASAFGALPRPPLMRKVEFAFLLPSGDVEEGARPVPALPAFEEAFAAFARGTLFATSRGLMAVEDLWPGHEVRAAGGAMRRLLWRGSTTVVPGSGSSRVDPAMGRLTRISADALGIARPMQDLMLGPHARIVRRGPAVRALTGGEAALVPAADLADGVNVVVITPASPVQVFHLGFEGHVRLEAHGVEVESQHPGSLGASGLPLELLALWLSCFPHRRSLADWGPAALPRLSGRDLGLFDAA